ncbi:MAG: deoxyribonuclease IV [Simkaniaceae bacterium]|nr:deoxyribonuclease IV [Simkaniaceae bacterium]
MLIGAHTSAAGGVHKALLHGEAIGATTIQLFTNNQKTWKSKPIDDDEVIRWKQAREKTGISKIMSHDSYLINPGSPDPELLEKSRLAFREELERCHLLELSFLNFHPGAATKSTEQACLDKIVESLLGLQDLAADGPTRLLLETTAGQGTTVGNKFEQLAYIIERTENKIPIGVCIDTCHIFSAGYDIRTPKAWDKTLKDFDRIIGLQHLYALHVNDSLRDFDERRDRHANLGEGKIGIEAFQFMMQDPRLSEIPKYLETPNGDTKWKEEIKLLHSFAADRAQTSR